MPRQHRPINERYVCIRERVSMRECVCVCRTSFEENIWSSISSIFSKKKRFFDKIHENETLIISYILPDYVIDNPTR